jgi:heptosyltransferase-2
MSMNATSVGRVLVRAPNWVGDAVMAEPAIRRLRDLFRPAHLAILARPWVAGLYEGEGLADEIIAAGAQGMRAFIAEARRLRERQFDLAVLLQNAFSAALLARAAGIRKVAGYPTDGRRFLLDPVIALDPNRKNSHEVFYYLRIAMSLETILAGPGTKDQTSGEQVLTGDAVTPRLRATPEARHRAGRLLGQEGIEAKHNRAPLLVLNPGATNSRAKQWLPERFAALADLLTAQIGFQTAIIGAQGDVEVARAVARQMRTRGAVLAGKTDISTLKGLLSRASLLISNDTGSAHVGAALGIPTIVVFGPTEHFATHPYSDKARVVRHQVECSPCMLRDCPIDHRCMTGVQVEDVGRAIESLIGLRTLPVGVNSAAHN